jgi:hypothetical protein
MEFDVKTNEGEYDLCAGVRLIGEDILVAIWGGEKPHIGAVAAAQPRPSLADANIISSTVSVICYLGHKDDSLAKKTAEVLAAAFNVHIVVTVGIHWDDLSGENISRIKKSGEILVDLILEKIRSEFGKGK